MILLFTPLGRVADQEPSSATVTLSTIVLPAAAILIVAPFLPIPEMVLSVDLIPGSVITPPTCNVGVTVGPAGANT